MIIVETTVWIDLFRLSRNEYTEWLTRNISDPSLGLTDLSLCEVLQGVSDDRMYATTRSRLLTFGIHETGGVELAVEAAENYRFLRRRGITVRKTIDCLIATFCIRGSHDLLHHDRDFDAFEKHLGLRVIHP